MARRDDEEVSEDPRLRLAMWLERLERSMGALAQGQVNVISKLDRIAHDLALLVEGLETVKTRLPTSTVRKRAPRKPKTA
jgi:hypothetical protein